MNAGDLLRRLPPDRGRRVLVNKSQGVPDIIREICDAHGLFKGYYDKIALYFDAPTVAEICEKLARFCKSNIRYREESDEMQTTAAPQVILSKGEGDCKHFASFCGGVLDALRRLTGKKIVWHYRFASYNIFRRTPYHVFIVVQDGKKEIWIDPTPGANGKYPVWVVNKKVY